MASDPDPSAAVLLEDEEEFGPAAAGMVRTQLRGRGLRDERVLAAMRTVPRHSFIDVMIRRRAYDDAALPTAQNQTISQPYIVAKMTEDLAVDPGHRVLEIGTGSGYQTMVLARLAREVVSVEKYPELAERARRTLEGFGVENVRVSVGDGTLGDAEHAPYDRILVTAGAPEAPPALLEQLAEGGRMLIPLGDRALQNLTIVHKTADGVRYEEGIGCRFVPLVGEQGWEG